jgi:septal ring factor EnvC (AmiA/AmiB activator)
MSFYDSIVIAMDEETKRGFERMAQLIRDVANRLEAHMNERFAHVDERFAHVDQDLADVKNRLERQETRQTAMELQLAGINRSMDQRDRAASEMLTV